jgi:glutaredoxin 3
MSRRQIEVFSAGCPACQEAVELVERVAGGSADVSVLDMHQQDVASRAKELGVRSVPAPSLGRLNRQAGERVITVGLMMRAVS